MSLEFNKLFDQVQRMGEMLTHLDFDLSDKLALAKQRFYQAGDLDAIRAKIRVVRGPEVSGYRGAAPLDLPDADPVNRVVDAPSTPAAATLIAADGSQVYPHEQSPVHYYLLNIATFTYYHGYDHTPVPQTFPQLAYHKSLVHDNNRQLVGARTIDARRTVAEMQRLAAQAWEQYRGGAPRPLVTLYDNHLLFWANADVVDAGQILRDYQVALGQLYDAGALLCGYIDSPSRSRTVLRLLYLNSLKDEAEIIEKQKLLETGGDLEGLRDVHLFNAVLQPGQRSAILVPNSPRNLDYRQFNASLEIAFFYVKVYNGYQDAIARVDIPMWVARDAAAVDTLHGLLLEQCRMQGRTPYPYALARADELAVVTSKDKKKLEELIRLELRKLGVQPGSLSPKAASKRAARSDKRAYPPAPPAKPQPF
jgi:hypothetical protein